MKVLVCGSRYWTDESSIRRELEKLPIDTEIVHGGARGADSIAGKIAKELGLKVTVFPAQWDLHGKSAGYIRNQQMLDYDPDLVLAFAKDLTVSRGTGDMVRRSRQAKVNTKVFSR